MATTRQAMAAVQADQLQAQSPCQSWDVAGVINHVVDANWHFAARLKGEEAAEGQNWAQGDYMAAFDESAAACLEGFQQEGIMDQMVAMGFADMPGQAVMGIAMTDVFTHGWDIAKATGQSTDLAPELAAGILQASRQMIQPEFRGPEDSPSPFGAEQQCADDACAADQLAAFLGRQV